MDYILCRKCDTGNPGYLSICAGCGADLLGDDNVDTGPPIGSEISDAKLRRNGVVAVVASAITTTFKIWLLIMMESSAHLKFPQTRDLFIILWPFALTAVFALKWRRWYLALMFDSIIMTVTFIIVVGLFIASQFLGR